MGVCSRMLAAAALPLLYLLLVAGTAGRSAGAAPAPALLQERPFHIELDVPVPLPDGTRLSAMLHLPADRKPAPVIFVVTPYGADRWETWGRFFARHGYVFASIDARGRGNSKGRFDPWINEARDGVGIIEWLARQPFSDGRVAAWGGSYSGKNQWAFATLASDKLKTIVPSATGYVGHDMGMVRNIPFPGMLRWLSYVSGRTVNTNLNRDDEFWAGAYAELSRGTIAYRDFDRFVGRPSRTWAEWMAHPEMDAFWLRGTPSAEDLGRIEIPVLATTGSYDDAHLGTLRYWNEHQGRREPRSKAFLIIGPWDHPGTRDPQQTLGGLTFGSNSILDVKRLNLEWYDWILKGGSRPRFLQDHVVYYIAGENRWASAPSIAAATNRRQTFYLASPGSAASSLGSKGSLKAAPPRTDSDRYVDDPAPAYNEGPEGGTVVSANFLTDDRIAKRLNGDGLIYETAPFPAAADLVGRPRVTLHASMDAPDADFRVQLYEVLSDGSVIFLAQDQMRARYRIDPLKPLLVRPGKVDRYEFDQFPFVARTIARGSAVRLVICPLGASIHHQRNRHSGGVVANETERDNRIARINVHLGRRMSRVELPFGDRHVAAAEAAP